jgi:hypothetical protein
MTLAESERNNRIAVDEGSAAALLLTLGASTGIALR